MPDRYPDWPPRRGDANDPIAEIRDFVEQIRQRFAGGGGGRSSRFSLWIVVAVVAAVYLFSGIYIVAPDERGVVLRFGRLVRETPPGPHYHLPWPIEQVLRPSVTQIRKEEVGFRTVAVGPPARYREIDPEALMLTGDENIVKLEFIVQYKVKDEPAGVSNFLFNVRDPQGTVRAAAESAMREVIGSAPIDDVLTEGKERVQIEAQRMLQEILDRYDAGVQVVTVKLQDVDPPDQVSDAFKDVISAQQDRERLINEARGYANDILPKARGEAAQMLNQAEGYAEAKVRDATGAAKRFVALEEEYAKAKDVTRLRLYLETMQDVLADVDKILIDKTAAQQIVPYLPLNEAMKRSRQPAESGAAAAPGRQ